MDKVSPHRGMEPSPVDGSGSDGKKVAVWTGEGVERHGPAERVGAESNIFFEY